MPNLNKYHFVTFALVLTSLAFFTLTGLEVAKRYSTPQVIQAQPNQSTKKADVIVPISLKIGSASIETPILTSHKVWEEKAKSAVYFSKTPLPGQIGNSVIYGHNWPNLLGNLNKAKTGDTVEITFNNGKSEKFKIVQKGNVTADQTHILKQTEDARITIYTCSGILDTKRLVVVATKI